MTPFSSTVRWSGSALLLVALLAGGSSLRASEALYVGARPATVKERPSTRASVVTTLSPGTPVQVFDRQDGWCWVVVVVGAPGQTTPPGWVRQESLVAPKDIPQPVAVTEAPPPVDAPRVTPLTPEDLPRPDAAVETPPPVAAVETPPPVAAIETPPPVVAVETAPPVAAIETAPPVAVVDQLQPSPLAAAAEEARLAGEAAREAAARPDVTPVARAARPSALKPPPPVGSEADRGSMLGNWFKPRALRASVGFDFQQANVRQDAGSLDHRELGGLANLAASFALLDPQIFNVDFAGEFQLNRTTNSSSGATFLDTTNLNSFRLDVGILTGRSAPLRLYTDRATVSSLFQSGGNSLDSLRHVYGVRTASGFTWDVSVPRLPRVQLSASTGQQRDERDYLFGYGSTNRERRAELRIDGSRPTAQFDADLVHSDVQYDVPAAGLSSHTGNDLLFVTTRLAPSKRLFIDLHARASRFDLGTGSNASSVTGIGGDGTVRLQVTKRLSASGHYSRSSNAVEAILANQLDPGQAGGGPVPSSSLSSHTVYSDGEARLDYNSRPVTAAAVYKTVSFGVPGDLSPTLTMLTTGGGLVRVEHSVHGLMLSAGADASSGTARSNQGVSEPYREGGVQANASTPAGHVVRLSADGTYRRVARLDFYPVNLQSTFVSGRIETTLPRWAVVHASVTRYEALRDILYADARDRHVGGTLGVGARWYDVAVDINQSNTNPMLLSPSILGNRPDIIALLASRPDLLRSLLGSADRSKALSVQLRPAAGLAVQGRIHQMDQAYPGLFGFTLRGRQLSATYQVRQVQLEFGVESYDSATSFGNVHDSRIYFRVRRDLVFIK